ncbi:MAG: carboxypeptidase-like regulatory domain-containing protein, partial [candidate division Zixibacteria bacterium]|nr:carboxypeptidase-like regulatory domain-containing protein [candidate division Zixibacteria bacterium]
MLGHVVGKTLCVTVLWMVCITGPLFTTAVAQTGQITGTVVDSKTGEPMVGASVMLENTATGAKTNLAGKFIVRNVPVGVHTLVVSSIGYSPTQIEGVEVKKGGTDLTITLTERPIESQKTVVVRAKANQSTEAALLRDRQAAVAVKDAISSQAISRSGSGTAAQAISRVTGASTDGKYVFIRGLGDRYTNTQLNGTLVPTPDPDKQAVPLDLIPADLLDNIVVTKSFTADMPGNFSGGSVNLVTKDFPEQRTVKFTTGTSSNSLATFKDVLRGSSSTTDWLGTDDGSRAMPSFFDDQANLDRLPRGNTIIKDSAAAVFLRQASQSFNTDWAPSKRTIPLNQNYGFQFGDNLSLFGRSLGMIGSLTYTRSSRFYDNGNYQFSVARNATDLEIIDQYTDTRSVDEVLWGGLAGLSYSLGTHHTLGVNYIYNRSGESEARFLKGRNYENGTEGEWRESSVLSYTERNISTVQFKGGHQLRTGLPLRVDWLIGNSHARQQQPDLRQFISSVRVDDSNYPEVDTIWSTGSGYRWPSRYWRDLKETNQEYNLNFTLQISSSTKLKTGGSYLRKNRTNRQTQFNLTGDPAVLTAVHGDPDAFANTAGYYIKYG